MLPVRKAPDASPWAGPGAHAGASGCPQRCLLQGKEHRTLGSDTGTWRHPLGGFKKAERDGERGGWQGGGKEKREWKERRKETDKEEAGVKEQSDEEENRRRKGGTQEGIRKGKEEKQGQKERRTEEKTDVPFTACKLSKALLCQLTEPKEGGR